MENSSSNQKNSSKQVNLENNTEGTESLSLSSTKTICSSTTSNAYQRVLSPSPSCVKFDSPDFDPRAALFEFSHQVQLPVPDAPIFNNISEYINKTLGSKIKKENSVSLRERVAKLEQDCSAPVVKLAKRKRPHIESEHLDAEPESHNQNSSDRKPSKRNLTIFQKMGLASMGPYSTLYQSLNLPIKIMIRRRKNCPTKSERFSNLDGILVAFDKHFNILLKDAIECYDHLISNTNKTIKIVRRKGQMMIRGDNVIVLSKM